MSPGDAWLGETAAPKREKAVRPPHPGALVEAVARAICAADPKAPDPDAPIYIGIRPALAWEGRIEMARAAIAVVLNVEVTP